MAAAPDMDTVFLLKKYLYAHSDDKEKRFWLLVQKILTEINNYEENIFSICTFNS